MPRLIHHVMGPMVFLWRILERGVDNDAPLCHPISMNKKIKKTATKRREKSTEWTLGQPLVFPIKKKKPLPAQFNRQVLNRTFEV
jgi:hypothetical protein